MNRGCVGRAGLGLLSLLTLEVKLQGINNPEELTAIPFTPWHFLAYSLIALAIVALVRLGRKPYPHKVLARKWISRVAQQGGRIRTNLRLASDGRALIDTIVSNGP